ncbi:carbohydrate ABC transporter permease [Periweissella ghanensis]|uniref:L-arabinose transport system permease protein AraQ n=1 Tax=Periweissella ghanensis TaxID=467997 RepID=A0ABN8BNY6_9LACO|nr:carbohydrate ABC transporter permease [Periweissella ghanensis]MCM0600592.1 carbohydrate ABC transporter permease [Periweissella ghanensis]CAH0418325.1 L-arabinose transport system permease protein AraQ [Periweissella ghanensis]
MKKVQKIQGWALFIILLIIGLLMVYPMIWMLVSSVKSANEILNQPLQLIPRSFHFDNFTNALKAAPFMQWLWNSAWTTVVIVFMQLFFSSLIAYALTQFKFMGRNVLFAIILATYMLPSATTYIPSYVILGKMHLINSLIGLVISNLANVFVIFLLRQSFMSVPKGIIEAARSDGASEWTILWQIVVPMNKNAVLNATLIGFITNFNGYLWPSLLLNDTKKQVISVGLNSFSNTQGAFDQTFPIIMAGTTIAVVPLIIVYVILQKYFVQSSKTSSIKG